MVNKPGHHKNTQSRAALAIVREYLSRNPDSTLADLRKAFPISLLSGMASNEIFRVSEDGFEDAESYLTDSHDILSTSDHPAVAMTARWNKESLSRLAERAAIYGIRYEMKAERRQSDITVALAIVIVCVVYALAALALVASAENKGTLPEKAALCSYPPNKSK